MTENQIQEYESSDSKNQVSLLVLNIRSLSFHSGEQLLTLSDFQT